MGKRIKALWIFIKYSGLWVFPCIVLLGFYGCRNLLKVQTPSVDGWIILLLVGACSSLYIYSQNRIKVMNGKKKEAIGLFDAFDTTPDKYSTSSGKNTALYPEVSSKLLCDKPEGIWILGKFHGEYVVVPKEGGTNQNILICGGSGSGKSTAGIIPSILMNKRKKDGAHLLVVDIKKELYEITGEKNDIYFAPMDRDNSYVYDPFFSIREGASEGEIYDCMKTISISLIPKTKSSQNEYWSMTSRSMLLGCLLYFYKHENMTNSLSAIIKKILGAPIEETIKKIITTASPTSDEYQSVIEFNNMTPETLLSVFSNLSERISPFATDRNLSFAVGASTKKFTAKDLLNQSIYLCIPAHKLTAYAPLIILILNQTMLWIMELSEGRDDPDRRRIGIIIDEASALFDSAGSPDFLSSFLRLCRSKKSFCLLCAQSIAGLEMGLDSKSQLNDILSNLSYKLFLDASEKDSLDAITEWASVYTKKEQSYTSDGKRTTTYRDADVITTKDLLTFSSKGEAILISTLSGYSRIKKTPYYSDKHFMKYMEEIYND